MGENMDHSHGDDRVRHLFDEQGFLGHYVMSGDPTALDVDAHLRSEDHNVERYDLNMVNELAQIVGVYPARYPSLKQAWEAALAAVTDR
jgi:hypothetical protein